MAIIPQAIRANEAAKLVKTYTAGETISALRVVKLIDEATAELATYDSTLQDATAIGVALTAATVGNGTKILTLGILEDASFLFALNVPLFLGLNGIITDTAPSGVGEFIVQIGHSLGTGAIFIDVREPTEIE